MPTEIGPAFEFVRFSNDACNIYAFPTENENGLGYAPQNSQLNFNLGSLIGRVNVITITLQVTIIETTPIEKKLITGSLTGIFNIVNFGEIVESGPVINIPATLLRRMASRVLGALRGIIYVKVKDTAAQLLGIPDVNLEKLIPIDYPYNTEEVDSGPLTELK